MPCRSCAGTGKTEVPATCPACNGRCSQDGTTLCRMCCGDAEIEVTIDCRTCEGHRTVRCLTCAT